MQWKLRPTEHSGWQAAWSHRGSMAWHQGLVTVECSEEGQALGHKRRLAERLKSTEWIPQSFMRPEEVEPLEKSGRL